MRKKNTIEIVCNLIKDYSKEQIIFTKKDKLAWLCKRNNTTVDKMQDEILSLNNLESVESQEVEHLGEKEKRFRCYFLYSNSKGRCYVLKFDEKIRVITVFPLGRLTLRKYRKKFK